MIISLSLPKASAEGSMCAFMQSTFYATLGHWLLLKMLRPRSYKTGTKPIRWRQDTTAQVGARIYCARHLAWNTASQKYGQAFPCSVFSLCLQLCTLQICAEIIYEQDIYDIWCIEYIWNLKCKMCLRYFTLFVCTASFHLGWCIQWACTL